jgi:hypothetical protein
VAASVRNVRAARAIMDDRRGASARAEEPTVGTCERMMRVDAPADVVWTWMRADRPAALSEA